jgi:hypothetical protein
MSESCLLAVLPAPVCRTAHKRNTVNPEFDNEFFQMGNLPTGTTFFVEVSLSSLVSRAGFSRSTAGCLGCAQAM